MKRFLTNILTAVSLIGLTVACNDVILSELSGETGYLSVSLGMDDEVLTKAQTAPGPDMAFSIEVKGAKTEVTVEDHRTLTKEEPLVLPVGKYDLKAKYGDPAGVGFNKPYYEGVTQANITTGDLSEASIICKLANVMVTVEFDESITDNFRSYSVFVEDGKGIGFTYSSDAYNLNSKGYLPAGGKLKWHLVLINDQGDKYVAEDMYADLKAQHCYNIRFALSDDLGDSGFSAIKLIVDNTVNEDTREIELDFSESELPSFSSNDGFDLTNQMSVPVGDDSKKELTFSAPDGIKSLILAIDSEVQTRSSLKWYELVEASQADIDELRSKGIKTQSVAYGATSAVIDVTDYIKSLPTGDYNIDVTLYDTKGHVANCPMDISVITEVDADVVSVSPWAKFVLVKGKYFSASAPEGTTFMYKKASESSWTSVNSSDLKFNTSAKTFDAEIGSLEPNTAYVVKAVSAADTDTREVSFTTGSAASVYNMNFDEWWQDGKVWYPYAKGAAPTVWDSANRGAATFIGSSTTPVEGADAVKGKAVRMESKYAVIAFAAGNLYTGKFGDISGIGAYLDWGIPFTSRPVALKGYYKYSPKAINRTGNGMGSYKNQMDKAQITVILADWNKPFTINTTEGHFVDVNGSDIIAFGRLESSDAHSDYVEFTIPLEYRYTDKTPKYIVIAAAASYLGDYFTGGEGSTLYIDELSFEYDATKLTDAEKAKVKYNK